MCDGGSALCDKEQTAFELLWEPACGYVLLAVTTISWSWGTGGSGWNCLSCHDEFGHGGRCEERGEN